MGRAARLRSYRRSMNIAPPMKLVPSKKGVATVFLFTAALGAGAGYLLEHVLR